MNESTSTNDQPIRENSRGAAAQNFKTNLHSLMSMPRELWRDAVNAFRFLPETNFRQACVYADQAKFKDAVFRLKVVLWLSPDHARAWYMLGACYFSMGEEERAVEAYKQALALNPNDAEALFMLATINEALLPEEKRPQTMPPEMAQDYFEKVAVDYDHMQRNMGYQGHVAMDDALRQYIDTTRTNFHVLDLGCGTGLCGYLLADIAGHLTGVDFTRGMLEQAMERKRKSGADVYDRTILRDIREFLAEQQQEHFDIVMAAHVFNYVGALDKVIAGVAKSMQPEGLFGFQVESYKGTNFGMNPRVGRFGHTDTYIQSLIAANGFTVCEAKPVDVYPNYPLTQYILKKG